MSSDSSSAAAAAAAASPACPCAELSSWWDALSAREQHLAHVLAEAGQLHLFRGWPAFDPSIRARADRFFAQVEVLEGSYPDGVSGYTRAARRFLADAAAGVNPFEGLSPSVPPGAELRVGSPEFDAMERIGLEEIKHAAFVLVAGGLGERLGYSGIKIALPTELTTGTCYLELYARHILAIEALSPSPTHVPLAIMTSDDTHDRTLELLRSNAYFGLHESQVTLLKQGKVASLVDNDAHIAVSPHDPMELDTKPHGHGDVHFLLYASDLPRRWVEEGRKWIVFFQDTNALCFRSLPAAIGVSASRSFHMNSMTVPRAAREAVGAIVKLTKPSGESLVTNVEYNQLDPLLRATINPEGDVPGPDGLSPFPGNTNQLIFSLPKYAATLAVTKGAMPEFVNPKYADASKTKFQKPTRLECMMQDYPRSLPAGEAVGFTATDRWFGYSPVKNNAKDAADKSRQGLPPASASAGETELYKAARVMLRLVGVDVGEETPASFLGITVSDGAHIVLSPSFAPCFVTLLPKFPSPASVSISSRSTLVLDGSDITVASLELDGALIVRACPGARVRIEGLTVKNLGWRFDAIDASDASEPEVIRMRGYKLAKTEALEVSLAVPGDYTLNDAYFASRAAGSTA